MNYIPKRWIKKSPDKNLVGEISNKLNVSLATATILVNRGINSVKDADVFLNPNFFDLENPFLLPDMEKAVLRLRSAVENNEKVLIYGDRDVDGVTAVCVMYYTLKSLGLIPLWYIPSEEGYGMHKDIVERFSNDGVKLIITVDCGISNFSEISFANQKGVDVIVTDHHEPQDTLPQDAVAVINPKRKDSQYTFSDLAGCTVALKLAQGLVMSYEKYFNKEFVVVDIETTGLHPLFDEIVEIAAIKIKNFVPIDKFYSLIKPNRKIPKSVIEIHGITDDMVANAPSIVDVLPKFIEFVGSSTIVAHNSSFDIGFIRHYVKKYLRQSFDNTVIDTLSLSRGFFPFRSHALGSLMRDLGLEFEREHRALDDTLSTLKVFERIEQIRSSQLKFFLQSHLDLVTLGTIADMMPLVGENRILVKHGLDAVTKSRKIGIKLLAKRFTSNSVTAKSVAFNIVPLLNSCGRRKRADLAVELLVTEDNIKAMRILDEIIQLDKERKELQVSNIDKFKELLIHQCDLEQDKLFFVAGSNISHGVTGIVASQIVREYHRPTILLIIDGDEAVGVGRAVEGVDIYSLVERCSELLVKFGGHSQAVGLTVQTDKIEELRKRLKEIADEEILPEILEPVIEIDATLRISDVNTRLLDELKGLEPFGIENPYPVFCISDAKIGEYSRVGTSGEHLKLQLRQDNKVLDAVGWGLGDLCETLLRTTKYVDIVGQLELTRFQNRDQIQFLILDLKPTL
ncbi:MAG: single-stranded-DNA-specific exonuclease RecJ [Elusimicrobiota bacterium]|nr:single-stranded-DNA-specific exonuclease RecJ [Elusimicrobiota bacterium]